MKKFSFVTIVMVCFLGLMGCSNKKSSLDAEKISTSTMLAKANGEIETVIVEDFAKDYYDLNDLEEFTLKEIETYNKKTDGENIICEGVAIRDNKAVMAMNYSSMKHYSNFICVTAAYFNGGVKNYPLSLPENLLSVKNGETISAKEAIQNEKYRVLVVYEPYEVIVDGKIKYYSENAKIEDSNRLKTANDGMTVIIFKP
jgi:hypothetical protein